MVDASGGLWQIETLQLMLFFFIPGFIAIKVYDLIIPKEKRDFSKDAFEVIGYSFINFLITNPLFSRELIPISYPIFDEIKILFKYLSLLFILPAILTLIYIYIVNKMGNRMKSIRLQGDINPRPWDSVFCKKEPYYVKVHFKDGGIIGGVYDKNSCASMYPNPEQIFLEEVWSIDEKGLFMEKVRSTKGMLILGEDIKSIEFIERYVPSQRG